MSEQQCVCADCAKAEDHISPVPNSITEVFIIHTQTKAHEELGAYEGDECEVDHNHEKSKSCSVQYQCDECSEFHDDEESAGDCCKGWECNFCGSVFHGSYWGSADDSAATCCAQTCDECEAYGWPDFIAEHECNNGMGLRKMLPWEERGIVVHASKPEGGKEWKEVWDIDPEKHDVVQAAADFYLLEAMSAGLVGTTDGKGTVNRALTLHPSLTVLINEAKEDFNALVALWDPMLQSYTHMACGGELRHHNAVGGDVLNSDRDVAWNGWKLIFEAVGPDALTDAAVLFREFGGGSFGGDPWAQACEILHARVTNTIPARIFIDRIFNAQHNGGVLLNKVTWKGEANRYTTGQYKWSVNELQSRLLPAHGEDPEPDYSTLLAYASNPVKALFGDFYKVANLAKREWGMTDPLAKRPATGYTQRGSYNAELAKASAKKAAFLAMPKSEQYKSKAAEYDAVIAQYEAYAATEAEHNARWEAGIKSGEKSADCGCGAAGCEIGWKQNYYTNLLQSYHAEKANMLLKADQYLAYELGVAKKPASIGGLGAAW